MVRWMGMGGCIFWQWGRQTADVFNLPTSREAAPGIWRLLLPSPGTEPPKRRWLSPSSISSPWQPPTTLQLISQPTFVKEASQNNLMSLKLILQFVFCTVKISTLWQKIITFKVWASFFFLSPHSPPGESVWLALWRTRGGAWCCEWRI